jgi:pimeloyl-ACP methyl ester carboxylesterase
MSYSDGGGGAPLLLVHGTGRSRLDWEPLLPALGRRRCIRPDLRGHGGSDVPREPFTLPDLAADLLALADALWLGRFDLAGHSLGGLVSLACAAQAPERIGRIVLIESWGSLRRQEEFDPHPFASLPREARKRVAHMHRETYVQWMPGIRERFWHAIEAFDGLAVLRSLRRPALVLLGDRGGPRPDPRDLGIPHREDLRVEGGIPSLTPIPPLERSDPAVLRPGLPRRRRLSLPDPERAAARPDAKRARP